MVQGRDYELVVKHKLIDMRKSQTWLIDQIKEKTGLYCDSSYLSRIWRGNLNGTKIVAAINEILELDE